MTGTPTMDALTPPVADLGLRLAIADLYAEYAWHIDEDRLETWLDLFAETCSYRIVPRENVAQGLPLALIQCDNRAMLRDRIVSLRQANIYNLHTDRHLISGIRYLGENGGLHSVEATYAVIQTSNEGEARLFSVGRYADTLVFEAGHLRFREKVVIVDNGSIPTLLATPL